MRRRSALSVAVLAAVALAATGCAPEAPTSTDASPGSSTLTVATTTDVVNFNPLVGNSRSDYWITNLMYPHLLTIGDDGSKKPELATKWGYLNDTTGYYDIRSGLRWSDGRALTAKDVAWTLNAVKKDEPAGTFYGQLGNFESARAVSDTRVEMTLSKPDSSIVEEIGFWGNVVPQHVFEPAGSVAKFANKPTSGGWVSAGPFRLTSVQSGQSYRLTRVKDYPLVQGGTPIPASVVYRVFPDVNTEILALKSGEVDLIANSLPPAQVDQLRSTSGLKVAKAVGLGYAHMTYNMDNRDLAKVGVRRALAQAVDYKAIRDVVLRGQADSTGSSPLMPVLSKYYDRSITEYSYDPAAARTSMQQAGYTADSNGRFPVSFKLIYSLQDPVTAQWAQLVKDGAAKAGITIRLAGAERNTYLAQTDAGDYDIYAGNFAIMDDPVTNFTLAYLPKGAINYTHVDDARLNGIVAKATSTFDETQKVSMMRQAATIVHDQVYDNVMYTQNLYIAYSAKWSGFISQPSELLSIVNPRSLASARPTSGT